MQPRSRFDASNQLGSQAWGLARWTAKMDNNLVSALIRAAKGLLPHAESECHNLTNAALQGGEEAVEKQNCAKDAIAYAKAVVEAAETATAPNLEILDRMHGLELPEWIYFAPYRAANGIPCYWSAAGEWVDFSKATAAVVRAGVKVPPDGVWIPYKTAAENTCWRAAARSPEGDSQEHFVWASCPKKARETLTKSLDTEHHVTILRAVA